MKQELDYFYGTGQSLVRISDRIYQPVDVSALLKREPIAAAFSDSAKRKIKLTSFLISSFLFGGLMGQLYLQQVLSNIEFGFLEIAAGLFRWAALPESVSTVFSSGMVGTVLGGIIVFLSTLQVPE